MVYEDEIAKEFVENKLALKSDTDALILVNGTLTRKDFEILEAEAKRLGISMKELIF